MSRWALLQNLQSLHSGLHPDDADKYKARSLVALGHAPGFGLPRWACRLSRCVSGTGCPARHSCKTCSLASIPRWVCILMTPTGTRLAALSPWAAPLALPRRACYLAPRRVLLQDQRSCGHGRALDLRIPRWVCDHITLHEGRRAPPGPQP